MFVLDVAVTLGYVFFLTFASPLIVGQIVDMVGAGGVGPDEVLTAFGPYILALIGVNIAGQVCSKLQDYACAKLEIRAGYELGRLAFDTLSNQSMTFHTNRFGGSLVSSTQKFISAYSLLMDNFTYSALPTAATAVLTICMLAPLAPAYVVVLLVVLIAYVAIVFKLYRKILPINAAASAAQNRLSGELSDSITNILAVKTAGREAYEQSIFEQANQEVKAADSQRMRRTVKTGAVTSSLIVLMMGLVAVFIAGGNAWLGISAGTLVMMFTYTNSLTGRFNMLSRCSSRSTARSARRTISRWRSTSRVSWQTNPARPSSPCRKVPSILATSISIMPMPAPTMPCSAVSACTSPRDSVWVWWVAAAPVRPRLPRCCFAWRISRVAAYG